MSFAAQPFLHSHSMIFGHGKALIERRKSFMRGTKNRPADPSEICALDFKQEFARFPISSVSATIGIDRSIFAISGPPTPHWLAGEKYRHRRSERRPSAKMGTPVTSGRLIVARRI
jgi:hypothetical protein